MSYYLAIDIGASSGRFILSHIINNKIQSEEIYRFENKIMVLDGHLFWDIDSLKDNVLKGLKICNEVGKIPSYVGIDSFGVDYVLLDQKKKIVDKVFSYRDSRTLNPMKEFHHVIPEEIYFKDTGIQPQSYNTLYQLLSDKESKRLVKAKHILMLPSYLNYFLTGVMANEKTILSTSGLLNGTSVKLNEDVLKILELSSNQFPKIVEPGTKLGKVKRSIADRIGYTPVIVAVCQHDTASAVMGSFADEATLFLSSGTWSLLGTITHRKFLDNSAYKFGFTNELGFNNDVRFLKNIMGLWIAQKVKEENHPELPYDTITQMARDNSDYDEIIDVNDSIFLSPKSMTQSIYDYLKLHQMKKPKSIGEIYYLIYNSLAKEYAKSIYDLECITGYQYEFINILGGGSKNKLLNELTEKYTRKKVISGPEEATAIGNVIVQMIADNTLQLNGGNKKLIIRNTINQFNLGEKS